MFLPRISCKETFSPVSVARVKSGAAAPSCNSLISFSVRVRVKLPVRRLTISWIALGLLLLLYFSVLAGPGLGSGFSHDDLMNLYFAWHQPIGKLVATNVQYWSDATRPLGALFYALFFDAFGLNPLPYRLFCFAILFCNIVLTLILVYRLTASQRAAVLATLLHCFHSNFTPLYYGSGSCYDVFAFFFFVSALTWYVGIRRAGRVPGSTAAFSSRY